MQIPPEIKAVFEEIKLAIDESCSKKNAGIAFRTAESRGLPKVEGNSDVTAIIYDFEKSFDGGFVLKLNFKSYDTSRSFEIRPDVNRFALNLIGPDGVGDRHTNSYEA